MEAEELGKTGAVAVVVNDTHLETHAKLLEEVHVVGAGNALDHVKSLANQLLADDLKELVLLEVLTGDV